jgi:hypothetical protein
LRLGASFRGAWRAMPTAIDVRDAASAIAGARLVRAAWRLEHQRLRAVSNGSTCHQPSSSAAMLELEPRRPEISRSETAIFRSCHQPQTAGKRASETSGPLTTGAALSSAVVSLLASSFAATTAPHPERSPEPQPRASSLVRRGSPRSEGGLTVAFLATCPQIRPHRPILSVEICRFTGRKRVPLPGFEPDRPPLRSVGT